MRSILLLVVGVMAGCATVDNGSYRPKTSMERKAYERSDRDLLPADVQRDFAVSRNVEVAWAGIIKDVRFKETERTVQVAFEVEHHRFDWKSRGGSKPYRMAAEGDGVFLAGWTVNKPTRIGYLRSLADVGDMLIVYGRPYRINEGMIQLAATAIRPVRHGDYTLVNGEMAREIPNQ